MKRVLTLASPVLTAIVLLAACEDSSSSNSPPPDGGDFDVSLHDAQTGDGSTDDGGPVPSRCPVPTGAPIPHNKNIEVDETWGAGLHELTFDVGVRKNATLTIEPCAVIRVVASRGLYVGTVNEGDGGKIVALGKADLPILIEGKDGARWTSLLVNPKGTVNLAYVTLRNTGERASRGGAGLHVVGDGTKPMQELATVDHVTIEDSLKYGVVLEARAGFTAASRDLVVKGAGDMALRVSAASIGTIPTGTYTGNTNNAIRIYSEVIESDVTLRDRGVPYVIGGDGQFSELSVMGKEGTAPVLTIEAGVVMKFIKPTSGGSGLFVDRFTGTTPARGVLRALGTAAKPIVFTSNEATPAAGDWTGIHFRMVPLAQNKIDHARIEYAGADTGVRNFSCGTPPSPDPSSNEAAIAILGQPPSGFSITNTVIANSAANAIERGWSGTPVDFLATNTFTGIAYCRQTFPRPIAAACPDPAPCD